MSTAVLILGLVLINAVNSLLMTIEPYYVLLVIELLLSVILLVFYMLQILLEVLDRINNPNSKSDMSLLILFASLAILLTVLWEMYLYSMKYQKKTTNESSITQVQYTDAALTTDEQQELTTMQETYEDTSVFLFY